MRALADFIMRGRLQAALIAIPGIPIISQSALALVTLRQGAWEGLSLLVWCFAPYLFLMWSDWQYLPVAFGALATLGSVYIGALCLRSGLSWSLTVIAVITVLSVLGFVFLQSFSQHIAVFFEQLIELQKSTLEAQGQSYDPELMVVPNSRDVVGLLVFGAATDCILVLVVGRWWQALLFNPGGFRREFSQLRLDWISASVFGLILLLCGVFAPFWAYVAGLPFIMVSISVAHQFAAMQRMGSAWLVVFYIALVNLPFYLAMAALGFLDSWVNLRRNLLPASNNQSGDDQSKDD